MSLISTILLSIGLVISSIHAQDTYKNYAELQSREKEGVDYSITVSKKESSLTVFAIHGGRIDYGTSILTRAIALDDLSIYLFEGIKDEHNASLHITSANFDEPKALAIAKESSRCLSIHGNRSDQKRICVGGSDIAFRTAVYEGLKQSLPQYEIGLLCKHLEGTNAMNIVNRCINQGVQLEFSSRLRDELFSDRKKLATVAEAIRKITSDFLN